MIYKVAPTFTDYERVSEPYEKNKKMYIDVRNPKNNKLRTVRAYTSGEWNKAFLKPIVQQLGYNSLDEYFSSDVAKKARGFSEGPITILKTADEDWLSRTPQCYYGVDVGWYITSTNTMPDKVPDDLTCSQMTWEEFKELKLCHQ